MTKEKSSVEESCKLLFDVCHTFFKDNEFNPDEKMTFATLFFNYTCARNEMSEEKFISLYEINLKTFKRMKKKIDILRKEYE